jgi:hypothetical protein
MNEQMKSKLHELADTCKHPDNYHQGPWMDYIQFAELIVRKCAYIANYHSDGHYHDQFNRKLYQYHTDIGKEIVDYFGVEE